METTLEAWQSLLEQYQEKFGGSPHLFDTPDVDDQAAMLRRAIETGEPIPEPDVPPGAII